jgi:DNA-binding NtrC family response regulator
MYLIPIGNFREYPVDTSKFGQSVCREPDACPAAFQRTSVREVGVGVGVLVVEDDHIVCQLIGDVLQAAELQPLCVRSDREAYAFLPTLSKLRAMVVDVNLGEGTTGFDVARFARQLHPNLAVVYVTGESSAASFTACKVPDSDFLLKPFDPDDLLAKLQSRLAG